MDSQDTMEFSALNRVHPMVEKYPLESGGGGVGADASGKVRFRVVLTLVIDAHSRI
jgi:hypothetical protein